MVLPASNDNGGMGLIKGFLPGRGPIKTGKSIYWGWDSRSSLGMYLYVFVCVKHRL